MSCMIKFVLTTNEFVGRSPHTPTHTSLQGARAGDYAVERVPGLTTSASRSSASSTSVRGSVGPRSGHAGGAPSAGERARAHTVHS